MGISYDPPEQRVVTGQGLSLLQASQLGHQSQTYMRTEPVQKASGNGGTRFEKNRRHNRVKEKHTWPKVDHSLAQAGVIRAGRITR